MLKQVLPFIIPTPLTERFGFQTRVFTSWISLGLIIGLICGIVALSSGVATPKGAVALVLEYLISFPLVICFFGLIGLGVNLMRGGDAEHPGWYWWLFPIGVYIVIGVWISALMIGFWLALVGINLPSAPRRPQKPLQFNPNKFRQEISRMKVGDLLKDFREQIEQLEQLEQQGKLNPKQQKVVRKIRTFDRSKYNHRLRELFAEEDIGELILMLLTLLGVEVR